MFAAAGTRGAAADGDRAGPESRGGTVRLCDHLPRAPPLPQSVRRGCLIWGCQRPRETRETVLVLRVKPGREGRNIVQHKCL